MSVRSQGVPSLACQRSTNHTAKILALLEQPQTQRVGLILLPIVNKRILHHMNQEGRVYAVLR